MLSQKIIANILLKKNYESEIIAKNFKKQFHSNKFVAKELQITFYSKNCYKRIIANILRKHFIPTGNIYKKIIIARKFYSNNIAKKSPQTFYRKILQQDFIAKFYRTNFIRNILQKKTICLMRI